MNKTMNHKKSLTKMLCRLLAAVFSVLLLYGLWLLMRVFLFDVFVIPTNSMLPTLQPGDHILVNKSVLGARLYRDLHLRSVPMRLDSYRLKGLRQLCRGDIVVFNAPLHDGRVNFLINHVYAKRCLALPGDSLSVVDGSYVNSRWPHALGLEQEQHRLRSVADSLLTREVFFVYPFDSHVPWTVKNFGPVYVPRCGDVLSLDPLTATYLRPQIEWELGHEIRIDWERGQVLSPSGQVVRSCEFRHDYCFMGGDNVCDSNDSRYWGLVPTEYIIGVAGCVLYGRDRHTGRLRRHRFMRRLP